MCVLLLLLFVCCFVCLVGWSVFSGVLFSSLLLLLSLSSLLLSLMKQENKVVLDDVEVVGFGNTEPRVTNSNFLLVVLEISFAEGATIE